MALNRTTFFAYVRRAPFGGRLLQAQIDGMNAVLDFWEQREDRNDDIRHLAYVFATEYHETGGKMQPVRENLNYTSARQIRKTWPSRFKTDAEAAPYVRQPEKLANKVYGNRADLGNDRPGDGWKYRGGGPVQTTGKKQYRAIGSLIGVDLVAEPERILETDIGNRSLVLGMEKGLYTGKKLANYFSARVEKPKEARQIVNGMDKAGLIEDYYYNFLGALKAAQQAEPPPDVTPQQAAPDKPNLAKDATTIGAVVASVGASAGLFGDILDKINNPYALGALALVGIGLAAVFIGRYGLAKREGV